MIKPRPITPEAVIDVLRHYGPKSNGDLCRYFGAETPDRSVDAALQKLRKAGAITLLRDHGVPRWVAEQIQTCPTCKGRGYVQARS
jgi:hypothetical protein